MSPDAGHHVAVEDLQRLSPDQLVVTYRDAAKRHGEATLSDDPSSGNADARLIGAVYAELRRRDLRSALLPLLENGDIGVRKWAAAHALDFAPDQGEPVLSEIARDDPAGILGFGAEMTLEEWRGGRLRFP
jgi:hypothetical protein